MNSNIQESTVRRSSRQRKKRELQVPNSRDEQMELDIDAPKASHRSRSSRTQPAQHQQVEKTITWERRGGNRTGRPNSKFVVRSYNNVLRLMGNLLNVISTLPPDVQQEAKSSLQKVRRTISIASGEFSNLEDARSRFPSRTSSPRGRRISHDRSPISRSRNSRCRKLPLPPSVLIKFFFLHAGS